MLTKTSFSAATGWVAQANTPDVSGLSPLVEKGGVWALAAMLMYWILGRLSKQLDGLQESIEKLTEKIDKGG